MVLISFTLRHHNPGKGNGNSLHYPCLENSMDRGAWWAIVHGVAKSQTQLWDWAQKHRSGKWELLSQTARIWKLALQLSRCKSLMECLSLLIYKTVVITLLTLQGVLNPKLFAHINKLKCLKHTSFFSVY